MARDRTGSPKERSAWPGFQGVHQDAVAREFRDTLASRHRHGVPFGSGSVSMRFSVRCYVEHLTLIDTAPGTAAMRAALNAPTGPTFSSAPNGIRMRNRPPARTWRAPAPSSRLRGTGPVRLLRVGEPADHVDLQPCGGTRVPCTGETGPIAINKIANTGRDNRRNNRRLAEQGAGTPQARSAGKVTHLPQIRRLLKPGRRSSERAQPRRAFGPDGPIRCRTSYSLYSRKSYRGGNRASISTRGIRLLTTNTSFWTWLM